MCSSGREEIFANFRARGVDVVIVYTREPHADEQHPQPSTKVQRHDLAVAMIDEDEMKVPVVLDSMDSTIQEAYGDFPNMAFILDAQGRVIYKEAWESPQAIRAALDHVLAAKDTQGKG